MRVIAVQKSDRGHVDAVVVRLSGDEYAGVSCKSGEPWENKVVDLSAVYQTAKRAASVLQSLTELRLRLGYLVRDIETMENAVRDIAQRQEPPAPVPAETAVE